jgi:predicted Zn-dependent protease with MMP-like domain
MPIDADAFDALLDERPEEALREALGAVAEEPNSADAHYALGLAYEALGRASDQVKAFLDVLRLEAVEDGDVPEWIEDLVYDEGKRTIDGLPEDLRRRLGPVTVLVEPRPSEDIVKAGFDPRLLGLFDGATLEEQSGLDAPPTPTRIVLFSHNLAAAFDDEAELRAEVAVTVLHEVGHFFGLDEDDMERLGLD